MARRILASIWRRLAGRVQWRILWLSHHQFMIGMTVAAWDADQRVLVLDHAYWNGCPSGLPSGYLERGESLEEGITREVRQETGLSLHDVRVEYVRAGFRLRVEVYLSALASPGIPRPDGREVLGARFLDPAGLPDGMRQTHKELVGRAPRRDEK